jgi:hypothetical protein
VVGSIPTVAGHIFQARPVWIYTQSNITNIIFTWVHNTSTEKKIILNNSYSEISRVHFYCTFPASYPGANNVLKIATLQCFYTPQWYPRALAHLSHWSIY